VGWGEGSGSQRLRRQIPGFVWHPLATGHVFVIFIKCFSKPGTGGSQPIILATQEAEIRRIAV
jgi:hypothetical protein